MTDQKLKPCPRCKTDENLHVFKYESGWRHVECVECDYLGPGKGNRRQAIKSHNETYLKSAQELSPEEQSLSEALGLGIGGRGVAEY